MGAVRETPSPLKRVVMTKRVEGNDVENIVSGLPTSALSSLRVSSFRTLRRSKKVMYCMAVFVKS